MAEQPSAVEVSEGTTTFDLVSSRLDKLHELLATSDDDEPGHSESTYTMERKRDPEMQPLPPNSSSEDITNRLKEALRTLDRLDEAVDAYTVGNFDESGSDLEDIEEDDRQASWANGDLESSPSRPAPLGELSPNFARSALTKRPGPVGGIIMDGWLEMKVVNSTASVKPNFFKKKWDRRYCVLSNCTENGTHSFVLHCYKTDSDWQAETPLQTTSMAGGIVALDVGNSSAGSIVFSVQTVSSCLYLRTDDPSVAHGWVTGMRGLQFAELIGWSELQLCSWLRAGGVAEETLSLLEQCNLDGMYFAAVGCTRDKKADVATYLQRNLGIGADESCQMIEMLASIQTPDILAWLEEKDRDLQQRYPLISDAVRLFALNVAKAHAEDQAISQANTPNMQSEAKRERQLAEKSATDRVERDALDRARSSEKVKLNTAAQQIQKMWRGGKDRHYVDIVLHQMDYQGNGTVDPREFYDGWVLEVERSAAERRALAVSVAATKIAAAFRGHARKKAFTAARVDKHFAAADIQRAWRKVLAVRSQTGIVDAEERIRRAERAAAAFRTWVSAATIQHKHRTILTRAGIRSRLRAIWEAFFAWEAWADRMKKSKILRLRALQKIRMRLAVTVFDSWAVITLRKLRARALVQQA